MSNREATILLINPDDERPDIKQQIFWYQGIARVNKGDTSVDQYYSGYKIVLKQNHLSICPIYMTLWAEQKKNSEILNRQLCILIEVCAFLILPATILIP